MPPGSRYSILVARDLQRADYDAEAWGWLKVDELHFTFERPDTRELIRAVPDMPHVLMGNSWGTGVYLGTEWQARKDAEDVARLCAAGLFDIRDPRLTPPRRRLSEAEKLTRLKTELKELLK